MSSRRRRIYEGKAKILYEGPEPGTIVQYFKDDATAFNNQKRGTITGKGVLNNRISEYLMLRLAEIGIVLMAISPGAPVALRRSLEAGGEAGFPPALQIAGAGPAILSMPLSIAPPHEARMSPILRWPSSSILRAYNSSCVNISLRRP